MGKYSNALLNEEEISSPSTIKPGKYSQNLLDPEDAETAERLGLRQAEEQKRAMGREQIISETPSLAGRISEAITGRERETEATRTLPEFRETEEIKGTPVWPGIGATIPTRGHGTQLKLSAGLLSSFTPQAQMDVIKENIPEAKFMQDEKGNIIVDVDGTQSILNKPGFSKTDAVRALTGFLSFIPAAKLAKLGSSVMARIGFGGGSAAATEATTQEIAKWAGSKEPLDKGKIATAGLIGSATEAIGPAIEAVRTSKFAKGLGVAAEDITPALQNIAAGEAAEKATGIGLTKAQKSAVPSELERQAFVAQLPAGAQRAMKFLSKQNEEVSDAVQETLSLLAPPESIMRGAERFRSASEKAVKAVENIRKEATSPIYKQAFRRQRKGQISLIDNSKLITKIEKMSQQFDPKGEIAKNLKKALSKIKDAGGDLQRLHRAKTEIDQTINSFGKDSVGRTTKRFLTDVKNDLMNDLVEQSPSYRAARDEFVRLSPAVEAMESSVIGKISKFDESQLKDISGRIFNPKETNPRVIREARIAIEDVDPDAWNDLLRVHLEGNIGSTLGNIDDLAFSIENAPSILDKAIFGNAKNRAVLYSALNPEQTKTFKYLETALNRAKFGRPGGSQTGIRKEISREFDRGIIQSLRNFLVSPVKTVTGIGEEAARNQRIRVAAEAIFSPDYKTELRKIRRMNPNSVAAAKAMTQLLNDIDLSLNSDNIINESE